MGDPLALLGIARRAGSVVVGVEGVRTVLREGSARLVLVAEDAAAGQRRKVEALARARGIPVLKAGSGEELGRYVGRPPVTALAVTDDALAGEISRRSGQVPDPRNQVD